MEEPSQPGPALIEQRRGPLMPQTNSNPKLSPIKLLRRKSSFIGRVDSSEELPSSHESIFVAEYLSSNGSEDSSHRIELRPLVGSDPVEGLTISSLVGEIDVSHSISPSIGSTFIKYGHGTPLTTIVEQRSLTTLRTADSLTPQKSVSELPAASVKTPLLGHRDSFELPSTATLRVPRRRKSFSADDLVLIKHSYHDACSMIELSTRCLRHVDKVYAEPRTPIIPPLERPSTPPGMPSWTAAQNAPIQIPSQRQAWSAQRKQSRVQRFLSLQPSVVDLSSRVPVPPALQGSVQLAQSRNTRSATSPVPSSIVAPRFRPQRSGHGTGPLEMHPFLMSEPSNVKGSGSQIQSGLPQCLPLNPRTLSSTPCSGNAKGKIKQRQQVRFTRNIIDRTVRRGSVIGSHVDDSDASALGNEPKQCHHRQRRVTGFWSLSNNTGGSSVSRVNSSTTGYSIISSGTVESDPTCQSIHLIPILERRCENDAVTTGRSPETDAVTDPADSQYRPAQELIPSSKPRTQKCWKCRIEMLAQRIDHYMEDITRCWCWICCGVDMDDDDEVALCGSSQEAMMSAPRRATLDSTPVVVF
jgi:hypothetical protein